MTETPACYSVKTEIRVRKSLPLSICIGVLCFYSGIVFSEYKAIKIDRRRFYREEVPQKTQMPWETNYWECILDEMPGVKTKIVAYSVRKKCNEYGRNYKIKKKSSFFGIKNASECVIEYAKDTASSVAARAIRQACDKLYVN